MLGLPATRNFCKDIVVATLSVCVQLTVTVVQLTVTCSSVIDTEFIVAFLLQQWLPERAAVLRYSYIVCIVSVRANRFTAYNIVAVSLLL